ncbi:hypothetical protein NP493_1142g00027 [Ridgeia piscesae]|uniref:Exportin-4 n=1 Tax=Ridgeia piscesae TaxID=27915 RepID=A0AAD9KHS7_RIDPI|nr:hypothetical protein NP493_1142g00027 [Ridgeia piscesae]
MPYALCTSILETSKDNYVLFQAASTIKECIIRDWCLLQPSDIESMLSFLMHYVTHNIVVQSYVREQILQAIAVIVKRGTLESSTNDRGIVFNEIAKHITSGTLSEQLVACSMLSALLTEYANTSCSSRVGLTWEFHHKCKVAFEETDLKQAFVFCLQVLHELDSVAMPLSREVTAVFNRVLSITQQILSWEFLPKNIPRRLIGSFKPTHNVAFKPPAGWRDIVLDHALVDMMFRIHQKVRLNPEMSNHSRQCLSQLASLNGPIFNNNKTRVDFLSHYIEVFLQLITSVKVERHECLDIASIVNNFMIFFPICIFTSLSQEMLLSFIEQLTKITCHFCQEAALEDATRQDDPVYQEAFEKLLDSWMCFVLEASELPDGCLTHPSTEIINTYLQCHLAPPDGTRHQMGTAVAGEEEEEYEETEEDDREKFKDQLCSIGAFCRLVSQHSVPLLSRLLEQRVSRLHGQLQRIQQLAAATPPSDSCQLDTSVVNSINEDLHWLLLVSAHLLTDDARGETPMIPAPIMQYSISLAHVMDVETTLKVLGSPGYEAHTIPGSDRGADPVVRLISAVFRLCQVEKQHQAEYLSPQVESSTMWFFTRWVPTYLLPNESYYSQMSLAINAAFGHDTDGGQWTIAYLLDKIVANLTIWCSEPDVIEDTLELLTTLVDKKERSDCVVKCDTIWKLAKDFAANGHPFDMLSASANRHLCKALVLAGSASFHENSQDNYWQLVLKSVHERFHRVLTLNDLKKVMHETQVKNEVISLLESMCGVTEATRVDNVNLLFQFLQPALVECVNILDLYHNYEEVVHLVLELFNTIANRQMCYLGENDSKKIYEHTLTVIQLYAKYNIGRRSVSADTEEDQFSDLSLLMSVLTNLLSKDFIDFGFTGDNSAVGSVVVSAADVVIYGLNIIVPLMTAELLKFPSLCHSYMRLVAYITEVHPAKVCELPHPLLKALMESVEIALSSGGTDVIRLCLEFIASIATHIHQNNLAGSFAHKSLEHFLQLVFHMLLLEPFDMDLLDTASPTLFCLICCHQQTYQTLVNSLLSKQSNGATYQRLVEAFSALTSNEIQLKIDRVNKNGFMENFDEFLKNVRGFLCVK